MGAFVRAQFPDPCKYCIEPLHTEWREEVGQGPVTKKRKQEKPLQLLRMELWRIRSLLQKQLGQILSRTKIQNTENNNNSNKQQQQQQQQQQHTTTTHNNNTQQQHTT